MDRSAQSAASIEALSEVFATTLRRLAGAGALDDVDTIERQVHGRLRPVLGAVVEPIGATRVRALAAQRPQCPTCRPRRRLVDRARARILHGVVGEYRRVRSSYTCPRCHHGTAPADAAVGLRAGSLSPRLSRVACRLGIADSFPEATAVLTELVGR